MTPGINRAYHPNSLNKEGKLKSPTAAAGLGIYQNTAFIPEPSADLLKAITIL